LLKRKNRLWTGKSRRPRFLPLIAPRFVDPSGGSHDSFTLGIAHRDKDGSIVLDLLHERHAPFNPSEVVAETTVARTSSATSMRPSE
jgi:hypothetical protein